ncbi:MAG: hypothetical protein AAF514_19645 [Verrucomicrobiota bacterium]
MTKFTCSVITLCSLLLIGHSSAQPPGARAPGPVKKMRMPAKASTTPAMLPNNLTIELKGSLANGSPIAMTLTGCGTIFSAESVSGKVEIADSTVSIISTVDLTVSKTKDAYIIDYSVGTREPTPSSTSSSRGGLVTNIQYHDVAIQGKVRCEPGKRVTIFSSGDKTLSITATESDEKS